MRPRTSNPQASALDLQSGDGTMYAGWGVTSIRCATQLIPSQAPDVSRTGKKGSRPGCGGEPNLRGYNQQLGTQYAHTASGDNFLYDISDYRNTGPDGPGYYKMLGNSLTKLEPGRSDDGC